MEKDEVGQIEAEIDAAEINNTWIEAKMDSGELSVFTMTDDFMVSGDDLKALATSASQKRKVTRAEKKFDADMVNLEKKFEGQNGVDSNRIDAERLTGYGLFDVVTPKYNLPLLANLYEQNAHHYGAVNAKTYNTVALGFDFIPTTKTTLKLDELEGQKEALSKFRKKLSRLKDEHFDWIESLNSEDTFTETLIKVFKDYDTTGNGYIEVGRTKQGVIAYVGHVPATTIRVRRLRDGFVQVVNTNSAVFFRNFGDTKTTDPLNGDPLAHEIIHLKKYTPTNDYYGVPDIVAAYGALLGNREAQSFNLDYFENKAVPRHVIVVKGAKLSSTAEQKLYEFFDTKLKGKHHRTLYIPLPADDLERKVDFKIEPVEAGIQDASFIKYKDTNRDEILAAHRVPITKLSLPPGVSLSAARDADKNFKEQVTRPIQDLIEFRINRIVKEKSDVFEIKLNELSLTDEDTQSKIDERYLRNKVVTPNEIRARMGKPGLDGGDEVIELKPQQQADARNNASQSDARGRERSGNSPDNSGEARNTQGEGRQSQ